MEIFTEKSIKKCTGTVMLKRGESLYDYGSVSDLSKIQTSSDIEKITATVYEGRDKKFGNNIEMELDFKSGNINYFKCDCVDFINLKGKKACKHIVAAFLTYLKPKSNNEEKVSYTPKNNEGVEDLEAGLDSDKNTNNIKEIKENEKEVIRIKNNFIINNLGKDIYISLELEENRSYKVDNILDFLNSYKYKNYSVSCEDGFVYSPEIFEFKERDTKILDIISSNLGKRSTLNDSELKLELDEFNEIIKLLKDKHFKIHYNGGTYKRAKLLQEDIPLEFIINKDFKGVFMLNHIDEIPLDLLDEGKYYFYKGDIYEPSQNQIELYKPLHKMFSEQKKSIITLTESTKYIENSFIPRLKDISAKVLVNDNKDSIKKELNAIKENEYFKTFIHLEKKLTGLAVNLKFLYDDVEFDIFSSDKFKKAELIKNRQIAKERPIINVIKNMGFEMTRNYFLMEDEDSIMEFMLYYFNSLSKFATVTYGEEVENLKLYNPSEYNVNIGITERGMLEFSFDIEGVNRWEYKDIFHAMENNETYYRTEKGKFIYLRDGGLISVNRLIKYMDTESSFERDRYLVSSRHNAFYVEQYLKENEMFYVKKNAEYRRLIDALDNSESKEVILPEKLEKTLRSYQKVGVKWIKALATMGFGGILADEMGLGKTLQAIAFIVSEMENIKKSNKPAIVIAPTSLIYNWEGEIKKFAPELKTLVIYGAKRERDEVVKAITDYDIVITSYAVIRNDISNFQNIEFSYCFIDEAQQIKNPRSLNTRAVKKINAYSRFALTGTPMENSLVELWSIFDFIMPSYLLSQKRFNAKYEEPIVIGRNKEVLGDLKKHITPFMMRRLKKDVLKDLPEKIESTILVDMTEEQKLAYANFVNKAKNNLSVLASSDGIKNRKIHILSAMTGLRQICSCPSVMLENYSASSGKLEVLDNILDECISNGHRILIFSQFIGVLNEIANLLKNKDIDYMYLDGSTKSKERYRLVEEFNEGRGEVFLLSLKAGGFGLNLTGADTVIHFDPWWNPAVEEQATDRVHRIGQKSNVEVIKLVAKGTIEEKILQLQNKKKEIIEDVISKNDSQDLIISNLTEEELEDLFTY
ncbi:Superfamily II DNA or RNA helicase, SNF2 family [Clostridium cavendishii DSM 21758]|uniref:Superfamily II DNA or RNA helicase, SNF2 family n=1 Tax=Clostridium cavendishii DSM 21758 TaxID=1121302 RepID=A0A1M6LNA8_9CLOT|nr:DEAD/DEAH box helicase [Clostridium cavendishii]SHJ72701.1 Superfamily II DNA or RNA helicase, SNF2 family [Clostridium cavendishii DSM 21758]